MSIDNMGSYIKEEFSHLRKSFLLEKRFLSVIIWELIFVIVLVAGIFFWAKLMEGLTPLIQQAQGPVYSGTTIANSFMLQNSKEIMLKVQDRLLAYLVFGALYVLMAWPLLKCMTYMKLMGKKLAVSFYWRFLVASISWAAIMALIITLLQYVFYKTLFYKLESSMVSRAAVLVISVIIFVLLCYLTITFFINLARSGKLKQGLSDYFNINIKGFKDFIIPVLFALAVFILLNVVMRLVNLLPKTVAMFINGAFLLLYLVWLKIYYFDCISRAGKSHQLQQHGNKPAAKASSKVVRHSVRK